ncbi:stomatin-like protein 3 [Leptotrombidium deliense]|uniref:Stomatin-like protein 3 n=1 Tax=Leptotrombidium deliense TaxID=299467 RepID=A0A443SRD5_9ACAR|nr:stomatin-like protein 3 [Leptotrombidium deliense]
MYAQYSKLSTNDDCCENSTEKENTLQMVVRNVIIIGVYVLVLLTFPFSLWFCIKIVFVLKRVKCLERCIIHRLGKRLPLRGPGVIVTLPCIDVIDFIDLKTHKFNVAEKEHLLTSDGSIVECKEFYVEVAVSNAIKSFTKLKDSKHNVQQFIKVSFSNVVGSTDIEDIERRPEFIFKQFVENCNIYVSNWGWTVTMIDLPKMTVIQRAEPRNPLMSALKSYFGVKEKDENEMTITENHVSKNPNTRSNGFANDLIVPLQLIAKKYSSIGMLGYDVINFALSVKDINQTNIYQFSSKTGKIVKLDGSMNNQKIHLSVIAANEDDLMDFLRTEDTLDDTINTESLILMSIRRISTD